MRVSTQCGERANPAPEAGRGQLPRCISFGKRLGKRLARHRLARHRVDAPRFSSARHEGVITGDGGMEGCCSMCASVGAPANCVTAGKTKDAIGHASVTTVAGSAKHFDVRLERDYCGDVEYVGSPDCCTQYQTARATRAERRRVSARAAWHSSTERARSHSATKAKPAEGAGKGTFPRACPALSSKQCSQLSTRAKSAAPSRQGQARVAAACCAERGVGRP